MMDDGMMGSMPRHHQVMMAGIPAPYRTARNPVPNSAAIFRQGEAVYVQHCASCHGASGQGDGPAAASVSPRPANLAWFTRMPMSRWDSYMLWTISEGGEQFGTAMPAFKGTLSDHQIWSVISYVRHQLGRSARAMGKHEAAPLESG